MGKTILNSACLLLDVGSIYGSFEASGYLRVIAIIASVLFSIWLLHYGWRGIKLLWQWNDIFKTQRQCPTGFLTLFIEEMILLPGLDGKTRHTVFISCSVISRLLRSVRLSEATLIVQIYTTQKYEVFIPLIKSTQIVRLGQTKLLPQPDTDREFTLESNIVDALEAYYTKGQKRIDITAKLTGLVDGRGTKDREIARVTRFTAWIKE